jgi:hypothetical protein
MTMGSAGDDEELHAELRRAFDEFCPKMAGHLRQDAGLDPTTPLGWIDDAELQQFVNAFKAMVTEALDGPERSTRNLIFETALPGVVAEGRTDLQMARSTVITAVMVAYRMLPLVAPEHRDGAARWLAAFYGGYVHELVQRAQALQSARR